MNIIADKIAAMCSIEKTALSTGRILSAAAKRGKLLEKLKGTSKGMALQSRTSNQAVNSIIPGLGKAMNLKSDYRPAEQLLRGPLSSIFTPGSTSGAFEYKVKNQLSNSIKEFSMPRIRMGVRKLVKMRSLPGDYMKPDYLNQNMHTLHQGLNPWGS